MNLKSGDILRKGSKFYRVNDFARRSKDVVCNQILYKPKTDQLVIAGDLTWISLDDIDKKIYNKVPIDDAKQLPEIVKRKYKLLKLKDINNKNESSE